MESKVEKKLFVNPWSKRENPNFYADGEMTAKGKRIIDEKAKAIRQSLKKKG